SSSSMSGKSVARGGRIALAAGLVEEDGGRDRDVQAVGDPEHRQADRLDVDAAPGGRQPFRLAPEDDRDRAGEVGLGVQALGVHRWRLAAEDDPVGAIAEREAPEGAQPELEEFRARRSSELEGDGPVARPEELRSDERGDDSGARFERAARLTGAIDERSAGS